MTRRFSKIVVLTGAGVSAESGVPTFRGPDGLWEGRRVDEVATADAVANHRDDVNDFFNRLRRNVVTVKPNPAHFALAELEVRWHGSFLLVTQNIDPLHEQAGSKNPVHMHGRLQSVLCDACGKASPWFQEVRSDTSCPVCGETGGLRPDIVLFGEMPYEMEGVYRALSACTLFVAVGTSGFVYPAAGFVDLARAAGAHTVEINLSDTERSPAFHERITGAAGDVLPAFAKELQSF